MKEHPKTQQLAVARIRRRWPCLKLESSSNFLGNEFAIVSCQE
jgi:hypothetical protein